MKRILLEVEEEGEIKLVGEVSSIAEAIDLKDPVKKSYYHIHYHDAGDVRPCRRVEIK